jgi:cytochrome c oxidase assembly factor CtaG
MDKNGSGMLGDWPREPAITIALLTSGALYVGADRRFRIERGGHGFPRGRRLAFLGGLVAIFAALESPIDSAVLTSFSMHMVQHLLLTMVAAPLLVCGAPVTLALASLPAETRRPLVSLLHSAPLRIVSSPVVSWGLLFVVLWGSHFSGLYEAALRNPGLHAGEHLLYLGAAVLFWMPVVGRDAAPSRLSHPGRILYLFLAMPGTAFLGLTIYSADHVLYPAYAVARGVGPALADQRMAGALMWTSGMFMIVPALAFVLLDWMRADEREARRIDERLARAERGRAPLTGVGG